MRPPPGDPSPLQGEVSLPTSAGLSREGYELSCVCYSYYWDDSDPKVKIQKQNTHNVHAMHHIATNIADTPSRAARRASTE